MARAEVRIELGRWHSLAAEASAIRRAVFVVEQSVPPELEVDEFDAGCVHAVARDQTGKAIGTGRLLADGRIGRMAVLREARGTGVGKALLEALMAEARHRRMQEAFLSAQVQAVPFYARCGYVAEGDPYDDAGIAHVTMRRRL